MSSKYCIRQTAPDPSLWVKYACFSPFCDLFWVVTEDWGCWWGRVRRVKGSQTRLVTEINNLWASLRACRSVPGLCGWIH